MKHFDLIVIGAGHAGCEAALAGSRLGFRVAMITLSTDRIALMSCNPAIGGVGKSHLVREIDAMGGAMPKVADATGIQYRRLNLSRGPAVQSTRCQSDSKLYSLKMTEVIQNAEGIHLIEDEVLELLGESGIIHGILGRHVGEIRAPAVILTSGTFLNGMCFTGSESFCGGRANDVSSNVLPKSLVAHGVHLKRFKTGTTPRLKKDTIDWSRLSEQVGETPRPRFSFEEVTNDLDQISCHLTYTNASTHGLIKENLKRSPLFTGIIEGTGPRYCPSIEDKVVRFPNRAQHTLFLEPEGLDSDWIYPNGLSTSLPADVQDAMLRTIDGLESVEVVQYGYAVEYDYAPPTQLWPSLMHKAIDGLFFAGQINGTSGYEEAAAQGLMAGLNAGRYIAQQDPIILTRQEAYIGVMIDDLITRGVDEPYRMFTSRAEHRLALRESTAERRLTPKAHSLGLVGDDRLKSYHQRLQQHAQTLDQLNKCLTPQLAHTLKINFSEISGRTKADLLKRPDIKLTDLISVEGIDPNIQRLVEEDIKYAGYIDREKAEIAKLFDLDSYVLPKSGTYRGRPGLSSEIIEKLETIKPKTLGQAGRIPGMTPAALALLRIFAHQQATVSRETSSKN